MLKEHKMNNETDIKVNVYNGAKDEMEAKDLQTVIDELYQHFNLVSARLANHLLTGNTKIGLTMDECIEKIQEHNLNNH